MPWRLSKTRKMRQRLRLKAVDDVLATVEASGVQTHSLVRPPARPLADGRARAPDRVRHAAPGQVHDVLAQGPGLPQGDPQDAALYQGHVAHQPGGLLSGELRE